MYIKMLKPHRSNCYVGSMPYTYIWFDLPSRPRAVIGGVCQTLDTLPHAFINDICKTKGTLILIISGTNCRRGIELTSVYTPPSQFLGKSDKLGHFNKLASYLVEAFSGL